MKQANLFDASPLPLSPYGQTAPYQPHSKTSRDAAKEIEVNAGTLRAAVRDLLAKHPEGLTDEQQQEILGMNPSTQRPRRIELTQAGFVVHSGRVRTTKSGRKASVWVVKRLAIP